MICAILEELRGKPHIQIYDNQIRALNDAIDRNRQLYYGDGNWPTQFETKYKVGPLFRYKDADMTIAMGWMGSAVNVFFPDLKKLSFNPYKYNYRRPARGERMVVDYDEHPMTTKVAIQCYINPPDDPSTETLYTKLEHGYKRWAAKRKVLEHANAKTRLAGEAKQREWDGVPALPEDPIIIGPAAH